MSKQLTTGSPSYLTQAAFWQTLDQEETQPCVSRVAERAWSDRQYRPERRVAPDPSS